ncbi:hypothetical protein MUK42_16054 [Musa troglodytarum]|uniref:Uncharacterized protein n=1 Tax=Musa troglodytarum TaxID=320322 RepID=A0A9E7HN66_9LILI|nr:hypothetical protein MUK42_16054 [Musa troglodytarum]
MSQLISLHPPPVAAAAARPPHASSSFCSSRPLLHLSSYDPGRQPRFPATVTKAKPNRRAKTLLEPQEISEIRDEDDVEDEGGGVDAFPFGNGLTEEEGGGGEENSEGDEDGVLNSSGGNGGRGDGKDYDKDPELAEILASCFDDPQKAQSRVEERIRRKRDKILHTKTGSATPVKVTFNKFQYSNSYIWFEFYNAPLAKDITLICDTIRSWHIVGRLGGCNSMNMQLSQAPPESKRPSYDAIQGANVTPTTFYNIGDLEIQDNLARIWVDIGISEPLLLDVLINALTCISSDYVGIKQVVFGGSNFENWKENLTSEDAGYSIHKI